MELTEQSQDRQMFRFCVVVSRRMRADDVSFWNVALARIVVANRYFLAPIVETRQTKDQLCRVLAGT